MKNTMKAAVLRGIRKISVEDVSIPSVAEGEILIKVHSCCVCGSDVRIFNHGNERVQYPAIIGHEMAGEVVSVGEGVNEFKVGDRIATGADVPSMKDDWSKNGMGNLADINYAIGYQFPGGFAEFCHLNKLTVEFGPVSKIPSHVPYELAALAEPLACCINGLERSFMKPGKSVLIFGAGPIGIMLYKAAYAYAASNVVLVDIDPKRIELAKNHGLENAFNIKDTSIESIIKEHAYERNGFDALFTACPSVEAQETAVKAVAKRGVVNLFGGLPKATRPISVDSNLIHYKEAYITGSHGSSPRQHKLAMQMIANGHIDLDGLVTHRFHLEQVSTALDVAENREGLKVVVQPGEGKV